MSSEFWAAIAGALVGGFVSAVLQWIAHRAAARERQQERLALSRAQARALLFKIIKIQSDVQQIAMHFQGMMSNAKQQSVPFDWKMCLPLSNLPREIEFSPEEMSALLATKDNDLFNDVVSLDHVHGGIMQNLATYRDKREELENMLPATMDGQIGHIVLDEALRRQAEPRAVKLDSLLGQLIESVMAVYDAEMKLTARVTEALNKTYSLGITTVVKERS